MIISRYLTLFRYGFYFEVAYNSYMERKGLLIILSGPSGVGKGTIRKQLIEDSVLPFWYSVSMTTRPMRPGEVNGVDYIFVDDETFDKNVKENNFLEHVEFVGHKYGTPRSNVVEKLNQGINVVLEIDVVGADTVLKNAADLHPITFFLVPPCFQALENRIRGRSTEDNETIQKRLNKAKTELAKKDKYDHIIVNDMVDRAAHEIESIIASYQK